MDGKLAVPLQASNEADSLLQKIQAAITEGYKVNAIQKNPHPILLDMAYYKQKLLPLFAQRLVLWIAIQKKSGDLPDELVYKYLTKSPDDSTTFTGLDRIDDESMKILNLGQQMLHSVLPFIWGKINRVSFGLLSVEQTQYFLTIDPTMPKSRSATAIPFIGKDVPSPRSEFSHPDIVIGLTVMAYRYSGLRKTDFVILLKDMQERFKVEEGPYDKRPSAKRFHEWVRLAGGRVRGTLAGMENKKDRRTSVAIDLNEWRNNRTLRGSSTELTIPEIS